MFDDSALESDSNIWAEKRLIQLNEKELKFIFNADIIENDLGTAAYFERIDSAFNALDWWTLLAGLGH